MKLALLIEYDGMEFAGWQSQRIHLGKSVRTVQDELEGAFAQIFGHPITVHGAGRTDTGVHARGMVAHVELQRQTMPDLDKLIAGLNATTGRDLVVHEIRPVAEDFHARHSAVSREYSYTLRLGRTALERRVQWATYYSLNKTKMETAAGLLLGEHDFTAFSKHTKDVQHYRCTIDRSLWVENGHEFVLWIRANRFVRGMVRALVGAMVEVGRGNCKLEEFEDLLRVASPESRAKNLAPARGLVLERVRYPDQFGLWK